MKRYTHVSAFFIHTFLLITIVTAACKGVRFPLIDQHKHAKCECMSHLLQMKQILHACCSVRYPVVIDLLHTHIVLVHLHSSSMAA